MATRDLSLVVLIAVSLLVAFCSPSHGQYVVRRVIDDNTSFVIERPDRAFFTDHDGELYFFGQGPIEDGGWSSLFKTDGHVVHRVVEGEPAGIARFDNQLFVSTYREGESNLYRVTTSSADRVEDARPNTDWGIGPFFPGIQLQVFNDALYFFHEEQVDNNPPTTVLKKITPADPLRATSVATVGDCCPKFVGAGEVAIFMSAFNAEASEDAVAAVFDQTFTSLGTADYFPSRGTVVGQSLYYLGNLGVDVAELWRQTPSGREQIAGLNPENPEFVVFQDQLVFSAQGEGGWEMYAFDGDSTTLIADLNPSGDSNPQSFFSTGDKLYFEASTPSGPALFAYDGVNAKQIGMVDVFDGDTGERVPSAPFREAMGGVLFAGSREHGVELFWTDGDEIKEFDVLPGVDSSYAGFEILSSFDILYEFHSIAELDGKLLFPARVDADPLDPHFDLFAFDGDSIEQVTDASFSDWRLTQQFTKVGGRVFFAAEGGLFVLSLLGDLDGDESHSDSDIDSLSQALQQGSSDPLFDVNSDGLVDAGDHGYLVGTVLNTYLGDANLDGEFSSGDLVAVFQEGKYETDQDASWAEGDWNADGVFGSGDLVVAFQDGGYDQGPRQAVAAVPEPSSALLLALATTITVSTSRRRWL